MRNKFNPKKTQKKRHKLNEEIRYPEVRVVGDNIESEVYTIEEALLISEEQEMDLVEISPNANPPVCRIVDYKKFLFNIDKNKKKQKKTAIKEIRFTPNTDEHDLTFKTKHAISFLTKGAKVKAFVFFKGREIQHRDRGEVLLLQLAQATEEVGSIESMPKLEGKRMTMWIKPKNNNN